MANLFNIEGICKTPTSRFISVEIEGRDRPYFIQRDKFEKWVDSSERRKHGVLDLNAPWELYYEMPCFEQDIYDYIIIMQGDKAFDLQPALDVLKALKN